MATLARLLGITGETVYQDLRSARATLPTPVLTRATIRLRDHALPSPSAAARSLTVARAGMTCPRCSGFAFVEPGGLRCWACGYTPLFRRVLPRDHPLSDTDFRNRARQRALDAMFLHPGRAPEVVYEMLDRLEGRRPPAAAPS